MARDELMKAVTKADAKHRQSMPLDEYIDVCQELIDYFTEARDASIDDMVEEDA